MTLETVYARAGVTRYQEHLWFSHCKFDGQNLLVWDMDDYGCIERCFLPRLREVLPTIVLTFVTPPAKVAPQKPRPSVFKRGYEPTQSDML